MARLHIQVKIWQQPIGTPTNIIFYLNPSFTIIITFSTSYEVLLKYKRVILSYCYILFYLFDFVHITLDENQFKFFNWIKTNAFKLLVLPIPILVSDASKLVTIINRTNLKNIERLAYYLFTLQIHNHAKIYHNLSWVIIFYFSFHEFERYGHDSSSKTETIFFTLKTHFLIPSYTTRPTLRCVYTFRPRQSLTLCQWLMGSLTGRIGSRPVLPVNHWQNVKTLTGTVTVTGVRTYKHTLMLIHIDGDGLRSLYSSH